jgi:ABC-2 type transport system permease protein
VISPILTASWIALRRDRTALGLVFLLPLVFFAIFATIFGGGGGEEEGLRPIRVAVVDLDQSELSAAFLAELGGHSALRMRRHADAEGLVQLDAESARRLVRSGELPIALIVPEGFASGFGELTGQGARVQLLCDSANPLARGVVEGLAQAAAFACAPDVLLGRGLESLEALGAQATAEQRRLVSALGPLLRDRHPSEPAGAGSASGSITGLVTVEALDVRSLDREEAPQADRRERRKQSSLGYYAAGISVMFLLFSAASAAGSLLEDEESGVLERQLDLQVPMGSVLLGKWVFFLLVGIAQVASMFLFAALVHDLELASARKLVGLATMTVVTAGAASAFGLVLACGCRTRAQLSGVSTILILVMSALGGSMVPRYIMPAFMETTSLFTFNGWAIDGYLKVLWHDDPSASLSASLVRLWPEVGVLLAMTALFLFLARLLARRWETI